MRVDRIAFVGAAVWAIGASIFLLLSPLTVHEVTASGTAGDPPVVEEITRQVSWYQVQGAWGVFVLAIFALVFVSIAVLAFKDRTVALLAASLVAISLVLLAGLSIGALYLPAAAAVLLGWLGLGLRRVRRSRRDAFA